MNAALMIGLTLASTGGLGYRSPAVGGFARVATPHVRALVEADNSRKHWVDGGHSFRAVAAVDGPRWRGAAPVGIVGAARHNNPLWSKSGAYTGAGVRCRGVYGYATTPDSSPNRTRRYVAGYEARTGRMWLNIEAERLTFQQGHGWGLVTRIGRVLRETP